MKTLKKNNISQGSSINSPVPVNKNCGLPPFFNPDYFGHVVVQTIQELYSIPCKLRQDGMVATVVQDNYTDYQLQSSKLNKGVCDNTTWIKVESSGTGGGNLLIFGTMTEANDYISFNHFLKEGQIFYIVENEEYYKYDGQDGLVDPFPYKLEKPSNNGLDNSNYKIPAYLDNQPYWISPSNFGKVDTVNGNTIDKNKNISLGIDDIFRVGVPKEESTDKMLESNKRILLYDPDTNISYWKNISKFSVGDFSTEDNTLKITDTRDIFINYNDVREDIVIKKPFKFPLQITLFNLFNEFSQVIVNEKVLSKKAYFILDQNNIQLNKKVKDIVKEDDSELRVIVLGKKFLNNKNN